MVETRIAEGEPERVFPVNPAAHGLGRLAVGQVLGELQNHRQREPARRLRGSPAAGEQGCELAVLVDRAERVGDAQAERAFGKGGARDAAGLLGHRGRGLRAQRHSIGLRQGGAPSRPKRLDTLPRPRDHLAGEFATSVTVGNGPISLAQMLRDQGRSVEAFALLQPVYDRFTEGFATADLKAAKALLDELA